MDTMPDLFHIGRKIKKIREFKGIKQEALAAEIGVSHQAISKIEQSASIDEDILGKIAAAFKIPADAIKNFNEEAIFNIIGNTVTNYDNAAFFNYFPVFNLTDKLVQLIEDNKNLYERLLQSEREKNDLLKAAIEQSKKS